MRVGGVSIDIIDIEKVFNILDTCPNLLPDILYVLDRRWEESHVEHPAPFRYFELQEYSD